MYDAFSSDYDRFVNWPSRLAYELPFIEALLVKIPGSTAKIRVLDAACGTGKHAIALAERGYDAAGVDLSAGMIEKAKSNSLAAHTKVDFRVAGFNDLAEAYRSGEGYSFDALLCLGNSLPHVLTRAALAVSLVSFASCLKPGGILLVQNRNFDAVMANRQRWMEPQSALEGGSEWVFVRFYDFTPDGLIDFNILTLRRENGGQWRQTLNTTKLRPVLSTEMQTELASAGFSEIVFYGDMTGGSYDPASSGNLVVTARKSATAA